MEDGVVICRIKNKQTQKPEEHRGRERKIRRNQRETNHETQHLETNRIAGGEDGGVTG